MYTATAIDHTVKPSGTRTFAQIDASSWISWGCYLLGFTLAMTPAAADELRGFGPGAVVLLAAVAVFFAIALLIQRHMELALNATSFGNPSRLVTGGVFRLSRNPIYVAFLVPLLSIGYFSPLAAFASCIAYLLAMTRLVIKPEEEVLIREFGIDYQAYRATVPRWFAGF